MPGYPKICDAILANILDHWWKCVTGNELLSNNHHARLS